MSTTTAADELLAGKKSARLEAAITAGLDAEIKKRMEEIAGETGDTSMLRSRAARDLLVRGALAARADRVKKAAQAAKA